MSDATRGLQINVTVQSEEAYAAFDKLTEKVEANAKATDQLADAQKKLAGATKGAAEGQGALGNGFRDFIPKAAEATSQTEMLTAAVARYAGPAALATVVKSAAAFGDALVSNARSMNVSVEAYQRLEHAGSRFKIGADQIVGSMDILADRVAHGNKSTVSALARLGIGLAEIQSMDAEQMFLRINESVSKLPTNMERIATLSDLGGSSFRRMAGMMTEDMKKVEQGAVVMADHTAQALARLNNAWAQVAPTLKAILYTGVGNVLELPGLLADAAQRKIESDLALTDLNIPHVQGRRASTKDDLLGKGPHANPLFGLQARANAVIDTELSSDYFHKRLAPTQKPLASRGLPGSINGVMGFGGDMPMLPGVPEGLANPAPIDASSEWADFWSQIEEEAAAVPPVIDRITTSTREATSAFKEMGIMAGIALSVPMGVSMNEAYKEAGVGSGFGGTIGWSDPEMQKMALGSAQRSAAEKAKVGGIGGGPSVTVNANGAWFQNDQMIQQLARTISDEIAKQYSTAKKW